MKRAYDKGYLKLRESDISGQYTHAATKLSTTGAAYLYGCHTLIHDTHTVATHNARRARALQQSKTTDGSVDSSLEHDSASRARKPPPWMLPGDERKHVI